MQLGVFMPLRKTGELTEFVRALRRRARQVRQRAFHDKERGDYATSPTIWMATPTRWKPCQGVLLPPKVPSRPSQRQLGFHRKCAGSRRGDLRKRSAGVQATPGAWGMMIRGDWRYLGDGPPVSRPFRMAMVARLGRVAEPRRIAHGPCARLSWWSGRSRSVTPPRRIWSKWEKI